MSWLRGIQTLLKVTPTKQAQRLAGVGLACALTACAAPFPRGSSSAAANDTAQAPSLGFFSRIQVPSGHQPALRLTAKGVQVFRCEARQRGFGWVFRLPEAELVQADGTVVGRHGADFSFEHTDGSRLMGKVTAFDEASGNLPWLLMSARSFGQGTFSGVDYIQRINTQGGMPPAHCEASQRNQLLRVDFSADFVFYRPG